LVEVSIVIPNKDRTDLLYRAVNSVLSQTFQDFEIIIVDDSSDSNLKEIKEYFSKDSRIRVVRGEQKGESWARKIGFDRSSGKYIALLDSDDYWEQDKLRMHVELFRSDSRIGVVWDKLMNIDDRTMEKEMIELPFKEADTSSSNIFDPTYIARYLVKTNFIHASCGTVDREKLKKIGGFPPIRPSDYILWLKMSEFFHFALVPHYLTTKFFNSTSMGRRKKLLFEDIWNSFPIRSRLLFHTKTCTIYKISVVVYMFIELTGFHILMGDILRKNLKKKILDIVKN